MSFAPSIRTRKWIWLAIAVLIAAAWIGSMRWRLVFGAGPRYAFGFTGGAFTIFECSLMGTWVFVDDGRWSADVWPIASGDLFVVPLWMPAVVGAGVTVLSFRRAGRRSAGICGACGYSLAGLALGACCPECGKGGVRDG